MMTFKHLMCGAAYALALSTPIHAQDRGGYGDNGDGTLTLICYGEGDKPDVALRGGYEWSDDKDRYVYRNRVESTRSNFQSAVQVELDNGRGRIHLTGKLVPPIHSGDVDGWWTLDNLVVGPDRITGSYRLNGLNKPRLSIDRRTGYVSIDGIEDFEGRCDLGEWGRRRF